MKIITLHCDYIKFKPLKKAIKEPEELKEKGEVHVKEPLVVLIAVEKGDNDKTVSQLVDAIKKTAGEVKAKNIVLYPYAHLSSNLANPDTALEYLVEAYQIVKKAGYNVTRAPFGYYKEFELKVKGHPLSELSKEFNPEGLALSPKALVHKADEKPREPIQLLRELSRSKLDTSKLKENDHRILGQRLDLFSFNESAPGMVFWHNNGLIIFNELINYWREEHKKADYQEISTPQIMDRRLWELSGHWNFYKDNMFTTSYEGREFAVKPMNCSGGMLVYKSKQRSYKDLPLRMAELGVVHRQELSGVLAGLFRVIRFTQDDAHIFCTKEQLESEIINVIELFKKMLGKLGFKDYKFTLSLRSDEKKEKYMGTDKQWKDAEEILQKVLRKLKIKFEKNPGEAKFYGPSLDVVIKDSLGREWQCSTLQLDFNMPERFNLEYITADNKSERPIMLHRVVYGSMERFIGVLLEHLNGNLPVWLSPIQVRIINFTDRNIKSCEKLMKELREVLPMLRVDSDFRSTTVGDKVRDASLMKIPFILVIGEKEEKSNTIAVRSRDGKIKYKVKVSNFIEEIKKLIEKRT